MLEVSPLCRILTIQEVQLLDGLTKLKLEDYVSKSVCHSCQQTAPLVNPNTKTEHRGLEVDKQIENLKELLQHDADAYSKVMKPGMSLAQIFSNYDSVCEKLFVKEQEYEHLTEMYNAKSEELYDAEEQIRNERAKVTKAEEQRRNDQKKRAHLRYQKEIAILQTQLSESEKKRHGCRLSTALDPKALEALGLETISDYVTFQNEFDLQLNLKKLFLQYNELKEDFKKKLEIEVNKQLTEMQKKLEDYKKEVELLNEARECVTDAFIRIQALLKEKDEYLRLLEKHNIPLPVIKEGAQEDRGVVYGLHPTGDEERGWLSASEEEEDWQYTMQEEATESSAHDGIAMQEDPVPVLVDSVKCSPSPSTNVVELPDAMNVNEGASGSKASSHQPSAVSMPNTDGNLSRCDLVLNPSHVSQGSLLKRVKTRSRTTSGEPLSNKNVTSPIKKRSTRSSVNLEIPPPSGYMNTSPMFSSKTSLPAPTPDRKLKPRCLMGNTGGKKEN